MPKNQELFLDSKEYLNHQKMTKIDNFQKADQSTSKQPQQLSKIIKLFKSKTQKIIQDNLKTLRTLKKL